MLFLILFIVILAGMMQKPFEDAAFGLDVGAMSSIVDTDSGCHLIFRIE
jgi:NIMA-interacting peptidyl-prolyl cis-trans isomerase 1